VVLHQILKVQKKVIKNFSIIIYSCLILALDIIVKAIDKAGYNGKIKIGMDVAASEFFNEKEKNYDLNNKEPGRPNYANIIRIKIKLKIMLFFCFS